MDCPAQARLGHRICQILLAPGIPGKSATSPWTSCAFPLYAIHQHDSCQRDGNLRRGQDSLHRSAGLPEPYGQVSQISRPLLWGAVPHLPSTPPPRPLSGCGPHASCCQNQDLVLGRQGLGLPKIFHGASQQDFPNVLRSRNSALTHPVNYIDFFCFVFEKH